MLLLLGEVVRTFLKLAVLLVQNLGRLSGAAAPSVTSCVPRFVITFILAACLGID